jgi:hypothetical protein
MNFLKNFNTRWATIPSVEGGYRLLCSNLDCSLSCANLKNGKLSVTSVHGAERHSYELSKADMTFTTLMFLNSLNENELEIFVKIFNKMAPEVVLNLETLRGT